MGGCSQATAHFDRAPGTANNLISLASTEAAMDYAEEGTLDASSIYPDPPSKVLRSSAEEYGTIVKLTE